MLVSSVGVARDDSIAAGKYLVPDPDEWATVMAAFDRLAERGRDYYHERVEAPADPVQ